VALGLPVGHRRQAQRREEALEAGVQLLDATVDRAHVAASRRQHGGPEGQMIRPRRADDIAVEVRDDARMHVWPVTRSEGIPGRLGGLEDLGGDLPGEAQPGPGQDLRGRGGAHRRDWRYAHSGSSSPGSGVTDEAPAGETEGPRGWVAIAVRSASSRRACTRSWISACRTASK
jgi:hypothetical protein